MEASVASASGQPEMVDTVDPAQQPDASSHAETGGGGGATSADSAAGSANGTAANSIEGDTAAAPMPDSSASAAAADPEIVQSSAPAPETDAGSGSAPQQHQQKEQQPDSSATDAATATATAAAAVAVASPPPPPPPPPQTTTTPTTAPTSPLSSHSSSHARERQHYQHHHHQKSLPERTVPHFVAPSSYLRPKTVTRSAMSAVSEPKPPSPLDKEQRQGLKAIREFLKVRTSYDVLPLSFRLIVLDTDLLIKKTLNILIQNAIVSAPLWDSHTSRFAGLLTSTDFINVIQYHCQFPDEMSKLDQFRLSSLRDIEKAIGAIPIETVSVHPSRPLYEACRRMLSTRARRIPLVDVDDETGKETVVSVITQYRILKFIAVNNEHNTVLLKKTIRDIRLGTYKNLATAHMDSTVLDVIQMMVRHNISCIPIVDKENRVLNAFEAVDVIPCIKGGVYEDLNGTVGDALCRRPDDSPGIYTCGEDDRLDSLFDTIRKSRVHRLVVVDDDNKLKGVISLSDILKYVLIHGEEDAGPY